VCSKHSGQGLFCRFLLQQKRPSGEKEATSDENANDTCAANIRGRLMSYSFISFSRSLLPRFNKKRPIRLRLEMEIRTRQPAMRMQKDSEKRCMGWLRLVGSLKLHFSFAEYRLFYRVLLQKWPIILRSLRIEATPYSLLHWECKFLSLVSNSFISFYRSILPRFGKKRPKRWRLEMDIRWHSKCDRWKHLFEETKKRHQMNIMKLTQKRENEW